MRNDGWTRRMRIACAMLVLVGGTALAAKAYRSPFMIVLSPDAKTGYVSDHTAGSVVVLDTGDKPAKKAEWEVGDGPRGIVLSPDGKTLFVALEKANAIAIVATDMGKVTKTIAVGHRPTGIALAPKSNRLYVCNRMEDTVSMVDVAAGAEKWRVKVVREPFWVAVTPDEGHIVVTNALPVGPATESKTGCVVSIIDKEGQETTKIQLPGGSTNCRQIALSPDGKWAYLLHGVSRFQVPTTQLERGWMNTSAISVVDVPGRTHFVTMLLDSIDLGAADPYGMSLSKDGTEMWVSFSGPHEVARIEIGRLVEMCGGKIPDQYGKPIGTANTNPWADIKKDPKTRYKLVNDLMAMYFAELIQRYPSSGKRYLWKPGLDLSFGKSPRILALHPDGKRVFVPNYYGGTVTVIDTERGKLLSTIEMGPKVEPDIERKGEIIFHDAQLCFQHWQSCSTCHPDARMDGLRWDLLNDGMGNHKKTRSLVRSHQTSPVMSLGVRAKAEVGVQAGFKFILFAVVPPETSAAVDAYLKSITPEPSPYLVNGKLSESAARGKKIFDGRGKCADCHTGPLYTDMKPYDVGTQGIYDREAKEFYTPKLIELHRIAPYMHDGRAATLEEVLTKYNEGDKHGVTSKLSKDELADLIAYLKSL